jgi:protein phosphatase methylesterase 1
VNTLRPSSREQAAGPAHWTNYFAQELFLEHDLDDGQGKANYHGYITPPRDVRKGPLFVCHHGAGASGLSFAVFAREIRAILPDAGILSLEARGHGSTVVDRSGSEVADFSITTLTTDALTMLLETQLALSWLTLPPLVLIGHSLGGAIVTSLAISHSKSLGTALIGYVVLDVVEGSALEALSHMKTYLSSRPTSFASAQEAIDWHIRTRTIRTRESADVSVPSLLTQTPPGRLIWRTDLSSTSSFWSGWFEGMSARFLAGRGAKLLILAGTDRLDRELMIGQMQGKFQLVVLPEAGHFVQEDVPDKCAHLVVEFFKRNDRSAMVLPPKVADLLAQGKKV